jgi:hypothetical protein
VIFLYATIEKLSGAVITKLPNNVFQAILTIGISICFLCLFFARLVKECLWLLWAIIHIPIFLVKLCIWGISVFPLISILPAYVRASLK